MRNKLMTKRTQTKKAPSTINSTAPSKAVENTKAQTSTTVTTKAKQAKTRAVKPTLASEVDRLRDDLVYANLQLSKATNDLNATKQVLKDTLDELYALDNKSWCSITYERFVDSLYSITKFFR
jgi:hypothetical protein